MRATPFQLTKLIAVIFLFSFAFLKTSSLYASGHGCATHEPDRDGDGVPDKDDAFPDDPSRYKPEPAAGSQDHFCGPEPAKMKLYYVPFKAVTPQPVTKDNIEKKRVNAFWFCYKNDVSDTIQNILDQNNGNIGAGSVTEKNKGPRAGYGLLSDPEPNPEESAAVSDQGATEKDKNNAGNGEASSELGNALANVKNSLAETAAAVRNAKNTSSDTRESEAPPEGEQKSEEEPKGTLDTVNDKPVKKSSNSEEEDFDKLFGSEAADEGPGADSEKGAAQENKTSSPSENEIGTFGKEPSKKGKDASSEFPLGSVDGDQIRLKVVVPESSAKEIIYLVDKTGEGTKNGQPFKLTLGQIAAIQKMVESLSGVVDLNIKTSCQDDQWKPESKDVSSAPI